MRADQRDPAEARPSSGSGRGDLARLLRDLPPEVAERAAALLGFEHEARPAPLATPQEPPPVAFEAAPPLDAPLVVGEALTTPFWRVEAVEHFGPTPQRVTPRQTGVTDEDAHNPGRSLLRRPPCPPLAPWSRIEPRLREALTAELPGHQPDVDRVVAAIGRGEVLRALPRLTRRAWPARLSVWVDRSPRHFTVDEDQHAVLRRLRGLCGPGAVEVEVLDPALQALALAEHGHFAPPALPEGLTVLVLGDLGAAADPRVALAWARTGETLRRAGVRAVALLPVGADRLAPRVAAAWTTAPWETRSLSGLSPEERAARADRLLRLASPAALVQPGLLRALRLALPAGEADAGTEFDALTRPAVRGLDGSGLVLKPDAMARLRDEFARDEPEALRQAARRLIERWHRGLPTELLHAETLAWSSRDARVPPPGDLGAALAFARRVGSTLASSTEGWEQESWRRLARTMLAGLPERVYEQGELGIVFQRMWRDAHRGLDHAVVPRGIPSELLREPPEAALPPRRWAVRQVGDALRLTPQEADPNPAAEPPTPGSPLTTLLLGRDLWVQTDGVRVQHRVTGGLVLPLPGAGAVELMGEACRVTLSPWTPEPWAVSAGRDRYGLWATLEVLGVQHRLRWIPPGRFWMGSPEREAGRFDHEGPRHEVELTQGYWLGETPVTQDLWEAVMGSNPSRFVSPRRPVEQVSWADSVQFCEVLNGQVGGLDVRLPTEAEWERGCRAATDSATWLGELEILGRNSAPVLDGISWYGGNSGVRFELSNGADSRGWPGKQHPHELAGTREVGKKSANPWGLCDMLGNVYEWCLDAHGSYAPELLVDPLVREGSLRVIRGGSWSSNARNVRAASRFALSPEIRGGYLGFRLARGPAPGGGAQPSRGGGGAAEARDEPERAPKRPGGRRR